MTREAADTTRTKIGDHVTIFKRGAKWYAEYYQDGRQQRRSLKTKSLKKARTLAIAIDAGITSGDLKKPSKAWRIDETVEAYLEHVRIDRRRRVSTLARYETALNHFVDFAKTKRVTTLRNIRPSLLREYRGWREPDVAPLTLHKESNVIKQMLNFAVDDERIECNPFKRFRLTRPSPRPQPVFRAADVETILAKATEPWRSIFTVLAFTGMRISELTHLTWSDVDLQGRWLHIRAKDGWEPKNGDDRDLPLHPRAIAVLMRLPRRSRWVFCDDGHNGDAPPSRIDGPAALGKLKTVLRHIGISEGKLHTFRHFFITRCADAGVPATMLIKWVGHSDLKTILHYYDTDHQAWQNAMSSVPFGGGASADGPDRKQAHNKDRDDEEKVA